jgi:hypothetical protein
VANQRLISGRLHWQFRRNPICQCSAEFGSFPILLNCRRDGPLSDESLSYPTFASLAFGTLPRTFEKRTEQFIRYRTVREQRRSLCPPHFCKVRFRPAGIHTAALKRSLMKHRRTMKPMQFRRTARNGGIFAFHNRWSAWVG